MKIAMLQNNFWVGDFAGNVRKILSGYHEACRRGANLVVSSELGLFGYPPKDMLLDPDYLDAHDLWLKKLCAKIGDVGLMIGIPERNRARIGKPLFNSGVLIQNGRVQKTRRKALLPTYDVFDEHRYFEPGEKRAETFLYRGKRIAILVCEDIWNGSENPGERKLYKRDPVAELEHGDRPEILIVINGSPYYWGKGDIRFKLVSGIAKRLGCEVIYVNQVGGNDDLVFDGRSFAVDRRGTCIGAATAFSEDIVVLDMDAAVSVRYSSDHGAMGDLRLARRVGVHDYVLKTGHDSGVVALSGGIDSAMTACTAVDALGRENVRGIGMPSLYSSPGSIADAEELSRNLGIRFDIIPINDIYAAVRRTLQPVIGWYEPGTIPGDNTEENVQARIRCLLAMAITNRRGNRRPLLISTSNKSESSMGFFTLYGDGSGAIGDNTDLFKTQIYALADYLVSIGFWIPESTRTKPPSAELRHGQKDEDSLPPYRVLDPILQAKVEEQKSMHEIIGLGFDEKLVREVIRTLNRNEFKRRQIPHGIKLTSKAFGTGRRWPIAAKFLE